MTYVDFTPFLLNKQPSHTKSKCGGTVRVAYNDAPSRGRNLYIRDTNLATEAYTSHLPVAPPKYMLLRQRSHVHAKNMTQEVLTHLILGSTRLPNGGWHEPCRHCRSYDEIAHSIGGGSH
eukprot:scaffold281186_cov75-Attheya_sp.AAC.1